MRCWGLVAGWLASAAMLAPVWAGEISADAAVAEAAAPQLEEIVVTADRRDSFGAGLVQVGTFRGARLIDVPLTVNVVPEELLDAQGVTGIYDALRNTAGVSRSQLSGSTYDNIAIRGILVENRTSYRLNGALPIINLVDLPVENKARVEVLKGVGALYYGFAPPSGIINLTSKRPNETVTDIEARANIHGGFGGAFDVSRRFGADEAFGLRVNGAYDDLETGIDRFEGKRYFGSVAADWDLSDAVSLKLDAEHVRKDVTETPAIALLAPVGGVITLPAIPDPDTNLGDDFLRYDAYATNLLARVDVKLSNALALTVEGGQAVTERDRDFSQFQNYSLATGEGVLRVFQTRDQRYRNRNARAELAAAFATGPVEHNIVTGVTQNWRFQNGRSNQLSPATAAEPGAILQNLYNPRQLTPRAITTALTTAPLRVEDFGIYAFDRLEIGDWLQLFGGMRYSDYQSESKNAAGAVTARYQADKWTPSVGVVVKPRDNVSLYATYLEGLEEGGTAPANAANPGEVLSPAISKQYELGAKAEIGEGLVLQLAGFQVDRASAFTDPADRIFKLAGRARYQGIEASASGELTPALSIYASAQVLDAEQRRAVNPLIEGKRPENTPKFTGSLFAEYRPETVEGLAVGAGVFHVGNRAVNPANQGFVDGYTTLSLSARYTFEQIGNGLTLQLNADNVTNERYWGAAGNGLLGVGLPRQVKLTARMAL
jgi:iron complex outermembrane recepter protein